MTGYLQPVSETRAPAVVVATGARRVVKLLRRLAEANGDGLERWRAEVAPGELGEVLVAPGESVSVGVERGRRYAPPLAGGWLEEREKGMFLETPRLLTCLGCGAEFSPRVERARRSSFCSRECYRESGALRRAGGGDPGAITGRLEAALRKCSRDKLGCLLWEGYSLRGLYPQLKCNGEGVYVVRFLSSAGDLSKFEKGSVFVQACGGHVRCVDPSHHILRTRSEAIREKARRGDGLRRDGERLETPKEVLEMMKRLGL